MFRFEFKLHSIISSLVISVEGITSGTEDWESWSDEIRFSNFELSEKFDWASIEILDMES